MDSPSRSCKSACPATLWNTAATTSEGVFFINAKALPGPWSEKSCFNIRWYQNQFNLVVTSRLHDNVTLLRHHVKRRFMMPSHQRSRDDINTPNVTLRDNGIVTRRYRPITSCDDIIRDLTRRRHHQLMTSPNGVMRCLLENSKRHHMTNISGIPLPGSSHILVWARRHKKCGPTRALQLRCNKADLIDIYHPPVICYWFSIINQGSSIHFHTSKQHFHT